MHVLEVLKQVPDTRRAQGRRHTVDVALGCVLLGLMSGGRSWRELGDFVVRHREALLAQFRPPKDRLPSYSTLRRVLLRVDFDALSTAFLAWARTHVEIAPGEWLSIDGKSLAGTITDPHDAQQNFTALVTLYAQRRGLVRQSHSFQSKEGSEAHGAEALLEVLGSGALRGAGVSADALHCRKKHAPSSARPEPTT